jgi:predicted enzyme related to lactoylglutathione lyase
VGADEESTLIAGLRHGQLCYVQIPAADVTAAARFYERVFGWRIDGVSEFEAPALIGQWVTDRPPAPDAGVLGWIHVADLEATLTEARRAGATVEEGSIPDGPRTLATIVDPAGNLVGLATHTGVPIDSRTMPAATVIPELAYRDVAAAIEWLSGAFGFVERWRVGEHRAQMAYGNGAIVIADLETANVTPGPQSIMVRVADARAHHDRAEAFGATILDAPRDFPYGERQYTARDLGGHEWGFSESIADLAPEAWGAVPGPGIHR